MQELHHKLDVLAEVAQRFNSADITWAVGASLLLFLHGKTDFFHDIDLMVTVADAVKARDILLDLGTFQPPRPNIGYRTKVFEEYIIDGVELDLMAGMVIVQDGINHDCSLFPRDITGCTLVKGQKIPLHSLSCWKRYYTLMGRPEKADIIEKSAR